MLIYLSNFTRNEIVYDGELHAQSRPSYWHAMISHLRYCSCKLLISSCGCVSSLKVWEKPSSYHKGLDITVVSGILQVGSWQKRLHVSIVFISIRIEAQRHCKICGKVTKRSTRSVLYYPIKLVVFSIHNSAQRNKIL